MSSITRWNPFREMNAMQNFMDRLIEETARPMRGLVESYEGLNGALLRLTRPDDTRERRVA